MLRHHMLFSEIFKANYQNWVQTVTGPKILGLGHNMINKGTKQT